MSSAIAGPAIPPPVRPLPALQPTGREYNVAYQASQAAYKGKFRLSDQLLQTITDPAARMLARQTIQAAAAAQAVSNTVFNQTTAFNQAMNHISSPQLRAQVDRAADEARADNRCFATLIQARDKALFPSMPTNPQLVSSIDLATHYMAIDNYAAAYAICQPITAASNADQITFDNQAQAALSTADRHTTLYAAAVRTHR